MKKEGKGKDIFEVSELERRYKDYEYCSNLDLPQTAAYPEIPGDASNGIKKENVETKGEYRYERPSGRLN